MENRQFIYGGVAALLVLILIVVFWPDSQPEEAHTIIIDEPPIEKFVIPSPAEAPEPAPAQIEPAPPSLPLPPRIVPAPIDLNASDSTARTAAADLSVQVGRWLLPSEQIRKWVVVIDRAADGDLQSKHRPWGVDIGSYQAAGSEDQPTTSAANYRRYDGVINALSTVSVEQLAYYLDRWEPLFEEAYIELGRSNDFQKRILMALDQVLAADTLPATPQPLVRPSVMYKYADVRLESASDIQKLMWRIGPDNAAKLQDYARRLRAAIQAPPTYQSAF